MYSHHSHFRPGTGRGAQQKLCPAGDAGQAGPASQPRACGVQDLLRGAAAWRRRPAEGVPPLLLQVSQVWECWCLIRARRRVCVFLSWAESVYVQSSCWAKSRRCRVPTEMKHTPVPASCRRGRSKLWVATSTVFVLVMWANVSFVHHVTCDFLLSWCQQRTTSDGCREVCLWQSHGVRAATTVPPPIVLAGVCTRTPSMSSTALSARNTTVLFVRYALCKYCIFTHSIIHSYVRHFCLDY